MFSLVVQIRPSASIYDVVARWQRASWTVALLLPVIYDVPLNCANKHEFYEYLIGRGEEEFSDGICSETHFAFVAGFGFGSKRVELLNSELYKIGQYGVVA